MKRKMMGNGGTDILPLLAGLAVGLMAGMIMISNYPPPELEKRLWVQVASGEVQCELVKQPDQTTEWECKRVDSK